MGWKKPSGKFEPNGLTFPSETGQAANKSQSMKALRNFFSSLSSKVIGDRPGATSAIIKPSDIFGEIATSQITGFQKFLRVGSGQVWASFKACDIVGKIVIDTPIKLTRTGSNTAVEVDTLSDLLKSANEFEAFTELLYKTVFHVKLTGNAYWVKDQTDQNGDRPRALYALNPGKVELVVRKNVGLIGYLYSINGVQIPFDRKDVIHFRNPHPNREFYGLGEVEGGVGLFDEFINRQTWSTQFWKNGASPSGILIIEDLAANDTSTFEKLKRKFAQDYGGTSNSGKTAFLAGKWNYQRIGLSSSDMQDLDKEKANVSNIFHLHGIPLSVAGLENAANFATAQIDDLNLRRYTVKPLIKLISDTINSDLIAGFDQNVALQFALSGLSDLAQVATSLVPLFDRGAISLNELRIAAGYEAVEDPNFNQHFINAGLVPLDLAGITNDANASAAAARAVDRFVAQSLEQREKA